MVYDLRCTSRLPICWGRIPALQSPPAPGRGLFGDVRLIVDPPRNGLDRAFRQPGHIFNGGIIQGPPNCNTFRQRCLTRLIIPCFFPCFKS
jgi:hypothetical protein